jgi:hypothetical protein
MLRRVVRWVMGRRPVSPRPRPGPAARPVPGPGGFRFDYSPRPDGLPNPGEVVWTWVPYEDDASQGKDRPVLLIGRDGKALLGLMLTSKDHDRDSADELRHGRRWLDIGTGGWDRQRRPSEVRLDRLLRIDPSAVRREGAALDRARFEQVAVACAKVQGWS